MALRAAPRSAALSAVPGARALSVAPGALSAAPGALGLAWRARFRATGANGLSLAPLPWPLHPLHPQVNGPRLGRWREASVTAEQHAADEGVVDGAGVAMWVARVQLVVQRVQRRRRVPARIGAVARHVLVHFGRVLREVGACTGGRNAWNARNAKLIARSRKLR